MSAVRGADAAREGVAAAVALLAKAPEPGRVKTRLVPPFTPEEAALVARASLAATLHRLGGDPAFPLTLFLDGALDAALAAETAARGIAVRPQADGDLGARLRAAFGERFAAGAPRVLAIGADSPTLPVARLRDAAAALGTHDAVLGPSTDGGYYLVGLARPEWRIFEEIPWSTRDVARVTMERAAAAGASVALLEPWYDVDDAATLKQAIADMREGEAFREALREAGAAGLRRP